MRQPRLAVPYATARSGAAARDEVTRLLRRFGCESVGFMDDFDSGEVTLAFKHQGRPVQLKASAKGWAAMFLRAQPWTRRKRMSRLDYERGALLQGTTAVNSILRDWVKGQVTAIECGILQFEGVFMPYMLLPDGQTVLEHIVSRKLLPAPSTEAAQ